MHSKFSLTFLPSPLKRVSHWRCLIFAQGGVNTVLAMLDGESVRGNIKYMRQNFPSSTLEVAIIGRFLLVSIGFLAGNLNVAERLARF